MLQILYIYIKIDINILRLEYSYIRDRRASVIITYFLNSRAVIKTFIIANGAVTWIFKMSNLHWLWPYNYMVFTHFKNIYHLIIKLIQTYVYIFFNLLFQIEICKSDNLYIKVLYASIIFMLIFGTRV